MTGKTDPTPQVNFISKLLDDYAGVKVFSQLPLYLQQTASEYLTELKVFLEAH